MNLFTVTTETFSQTLIAISFRAPLESVSPYHLSLWSFCVFLLLRASIVLFALCPLVSHSGLPRPRSSDRSLRSPCRKTHQVEARAVSVAIGYIWTSKVLSHSCPQTSCADACILVTSVFVSKRRLGCTLPFQLKYEYGTLTQYSIPFGHNLNSQSLLQTTSKSSC